MKGIKEYAIREEKLNELKSTLNLFQFNEMFKNTGTDSDVISWIGSETKNIAEGKYDENVRDAFGVAITKLDSKVANPEINMDPHEKQRLMEDLRRLKWASDTLQRVANLENLGTLEENSQEARDFIEAQNVLANASQVRERFDTFNEVSGFKNVKEDYFQVIDRFLSTCETVKFDMDDLEYKVDVDKAYDEVIARQRESENVTTNIYNGINTEVEAAINSNLNPEKILNRGYSDEVRIFNNTMQNELNIYGEERRKIEKEFQSYVNQWNKKEIELCEERKILESTSSKIVEKMLKDELSVLENEEKELETYNKNIDQITEDVRKNVEIEIQKIREEEETELSRIINEEFVEERRAMERNMSALNLSDAKNEVTEKAEKLKSAKAELELAQGQYNKVFAEHQEKYDKAKMYVQGDDEARLREKEQERTYLNEVTEAENKLAGINEGIPEKFRNDFNKKMSVLTALTLEVQPRIDANVTLYQKIDEKLNLNPKIFSKPSEAANEIRKMLASTDDSLDKTVFDDYSRRECLEFLIDDMDDLRVALAYTYIDISKQDNNFNLEEFRKSKEIQKAMAEADARIAEIAKSGKGNILTQIANEIRNRAKETELNFNQLNAKYSDEVDKTVQLDSKDPLVEIDSFITKQANVFDKKAYFSKEDLNENGSIKLPQGTFKRFGLTTDRDSLTAITIGKVLDNIRVAGKVSAEQYAEAFNPQKLVNEKHTFAKKVMGNISYGLELSERDKKNNSTIEAQQKLLKEREVNAKEMIGNDIYTGMKACIDIIDDRMKELNGEFSLQTLLKPENRYLFSVADTLHDLYQEFGKSDIKEVFSNRYEAPKGKLPKNAALDVSNKAEAVCNIIKTMNRAMYEINQFAESDYSKGIPSMESSKMFYEIAQIKGIESNVSELINKNKGGGLFGINKKFNKKFSDLVSEKVPTDEKKSTYGSQSQIITLGVRAANSVISNDIGCIDELSNLEKVDKNGVCGINLVARNFLLNPNSVPGMGYKYNPANGKTSDLSIGNFVGYMKKLNLSEPTKDNPIKSMSKNHERIMNKVDIKPFAEEAINTIHGVQKQKEELYKASLKSKKSQNYIARVNKLTAKEKENVILAGNKVGEIEDELANSKQIYAAKVKASRLEYKKLIEKAKVYGFSKATEVEYTISNYAKMRSAKRKEIDAAKEKVNINKQRLEEIKGKKEEIRNKYADKTFVREIIDQKARDLREEVSNFAEESISKRYELETKKNLYKNLESVTNANSDKIIKAYRKFVPHSNKFLELKEMDDNRIQNNKTVVTTANTKLNALQNEQARIGRFTNKLNDFRNAIEQNRDMDHKDTTEFTRMKTAIENASRASTYEEMKTSLTELQTATNEYIRLKNKWPVPRAFASEMRYSRLTAAGNIVNFCKKAIDNCAKYESEKSQVCRGFMNENGPTSVIQNTVISQIKAKSGEYIRENHLDLEVLNNSCKVEANHIIDEHKNTVKTLNDNLEGNIKESIKNGLSKEKDNVINVIMNKYDNILKKVANVQKEKSIKQPSIDKKKDVIENPKVQISLN